MQKCITHWYTHIYVVQAGGFTKSVIVCAEVCLWVTWWKNGLLRFSSTNLTTSVPLSSGSSITVNRSAAPLFICPSPTLPWLNQHLSLEPQAEYKGIMETFKCNTKKSKRREVGTILFTKLMALMLWSTKNCCAVTNWCVILKKKCVNLLYQPALLIFPDYLEGVLRQTIFSLCVWLWECCPLPLRV